MSFPCTRCGLCCQKIKGIAELEEFHSGNGKCKHYSQHKGCLIYQKRPLVCRIDEGYEKLFSQLVGLKEYYQKNAEVCNSLQQEQDYPPRYRVNLDNGH